MARESVVCKAGPQPLDEANTALGVALDFIAAIPIAWGQRWLALVIPDVPCRTKLRRSLQRLVLDHRDVKPTHAMVPVRVAAFVRPATAMITIGKP